MADVHKISGRDAPAGNSVSGDASDSDTDRQAFVTESSSGGDGRSSRAAPKSRRGRWILLALLMISVAWLRPWGVPIDHWLDKRLRFTVGDWTIAPWQSDLSFQAAANAEKTQEQIPQIWKELAGLRSQLASWNAVNADISSTKQDHDQRLKILEESLSSLDDMVYEALRLAQQSLAKSEKELAAEPVESVSLSAEFLDKSAGGQRADQQSALLSHQGSSADEKAALAAAQPAPDSDSGAVLAVRRWVAVLEAGIALSRLEGHLASGKPYVQGLQTLRQSMRMIMGADAFGVHPSWQVLDSHAEQGVLSLSALRERWEYLWRNGHSLASSVSPANNVQGDVLLSQKADGSEESLSAWERLWRVVARVLRIQVGHVDALPSPDFAGRVSLNSPYFADVRGVAQLLARDQVSDAVPLAQDLLARLEKDSGSLQVSVLHEWLQAASAYRQSWEALSQMDRRWQEAARSLP